MKQLVVLSGRGGTGKTTVVAGLAPLIAKDARLVLVDADVDAAHLEMLLSPTPVAEHDFRGGTLAVIDEDGCIACGVCVDVCPQDSISMVIGTSRPGYIKEVRTYIKEVTEERAEDRPQP